MLTLTPTLLNPTNRSRNSKTTKVTSFQLISPNNHPDDTILRICCIQDYYFLSACARPHWLAYV